ncbi:MAG: hypothetical protein DRJ40_03345 [Thermoprotei archaeon]|nr:MAG: hypothetical protein DRJ40_03345 [Thermoprotei archaeon]
MGTVVFIALFDGVHQRELSPIKSTLESRSFSTRILAVDNDIPINYWCQLSKLSAEDLSKLVDEGNALVILGGYRLYYIVTGKKPAKIKYRKPCPGLSNLLEIIKLFNERKKIIATALAGPALLARLGILKGKRATVLPTTDLVYIMRENGVEITYSPVEVSDNIITAKNIEDIPLLARTLVEVLEKQTPKAITA